MKCPAPARRTANSPDVRDTRPAALVAAAHVCALGRWIEMLQSQGVNQYDDGLIELTRRQQHLERDQREHDPLD